MKKTKTETKSGNQPTLVAFLLDRSGSMESCAQETIKGFNGYIDELAKGDKSGSVFTLTQFDSQGIDIVHDAVKLGNVDHLNTRTFVPRGGTPLYDAIGKTIRATQEKAGKKFKVLFVTLTDGMENASSEWNSTTIKALMKKQEDDHHWTFAHIGVGLAGWAAADHLAQGTRSISNVSKVSGKNAGKAFMATATASLRYMSSGISGQSVCSNLYSQDEKLDESNP
jgi:uncharacterized protein YegL